MLYKKIFLLLFFSLLFVACATPTYTKQESAFIVFKTPAFKHADLGFIYENDTQTKVEIYSNGQALLSLTVGEEHICMSSFECLDKKSFNQKVLSKYYLEDILSNIFRGKAIFSGEKQQKIRNGFTQKIFKQGKYDIEYRVFNKQIVFRDTMNNILIKITRLK